MNSSEKTVALQLQAWLALSFGGLIMGVLWGGMFALFAESIHHSSTPETVRALSSGAAHHLSYALFLAGLALGTAGQAISAALKL